MQYLKADTITEVTIGPAVAVGDGFTPVTSLIGLNANEFEIIKHGATTTTTIAGTLAAITGADGYYALDLSATDTNTEGRLTILINDDSLILPIRHEFMVVNANVYDSLFAASGTDSLTVTLADGAHGGTAATMTFEQITVLATSLDADAVTLTGNGDGVGLKSNGGASGAGVIFTGFGSSPGLSSTGGSSGGDGFFIQGQGGGDGARFIGNAAGAGLNIDGGVTGIGMDIAGGATSGDGVRVTVVSGSEINADIAGTITNLLQLGGQVITAAAGITINAELGASAMAMNDFEKQYDGTGLISDTAPARQDQVTNLANVGSAVNKTPTSYTLTTGLELSGTVASVAALDGTNHEHTSVANVLDLYYEFNIGSGTPSSVTVTGYLNSSNDDLEVYGYDWVTAAWVQIGVLAGKNPSTNEVNSYDLFVDMVGMAGNEGIVRIRFTDGAFTLSSATLAIDQIFCSFSQGSEGYDNGSVWIDTNASNTNTVVGIDGVARNPVSTIAAANALLASTNLHRLTYAPGSSVTFAASQTNELHLGQDYTIALGSQNITGIYIGGAILSGISTATGRFVVNGSQLNACTFDNDGLFERCSISGTQTIGQAGTYTYHNCYSENGVAVSIDFAAVGATKVHLFGFNGSIDFTNMAAGDSVEITGNGTITTTTCTGGTINHDGFFEYTDAGGNVTEQQSDIKVNVDAILVDTNELQTDDIPGLIATAQTDLDTITGVDGATLATLQALYAPAKAADVATELATYDGPTKAEMDTAHGLLATEAKQDIIDTNVDSILIRLPNRPTKNAALANFPFLMVLSLDHVTGATGKTITATRRIDSGTFASTANAATEVSTGVYTINLAASDLNGDTIMFRFAAAASDDTFIQVVTQK